MNKIFKQYNIKGVGSSIYTLYLAAPMIGIFMYIINAFTFYVVARDKYFPWINPPLFILFACVGLILLLFVFFKFVLPSYISFINRQSYIHNNPIQMDLAKIKKKLGIEDDE
jgi:hypothetical protein